ncbi:MAG TPA: SLC13 family permease [Gaiellaceae bacterium]|nr:SLC13 family permease [Gaiellaceae bacterium]
MTLSNSHAAFSQAWPAFALVAGLLLVGGTAGREGLFAEVGALAARVRGGGATLLVSLLLVTAIVSAVLNLDTAVVFMTPVLVHAARHRGLGEAPFLYGAVFMANSASLLLPGSNLTNLIVLAQDHVSGSTFAARLWPAWLVAVAVTIAFVTVAFRRDLVPRGASEPERAAFRPGAGTAAAAVSSVLVLVLSQPALPVLALGAAAAIAGRLPLRSALRAANPLLLGSVLAVAVLLGTVARAVHGLGHLATHAGRWATMWIGAGAAIAVNNLPAAAVLSAHAPAHPRALLLGLDLGPNLAVTGSLSAALWLQVARANGARPSVVRYSLLGLALAPVSLGLALLTATRF